MIRDNEIKRLVSYLNGLGVKVTFYSKNNSEGEADWATDGSEICVYSVKKKSKTKILLDLIHEAGHMVWFIHAKDRQPDLKYEEALERPTDSTPKHLRKKILSTEIEGTKWWDTIIKDVDIKLPKWKIEASKEFDIWMYEVYYETGLFPAGKIRNERYRSIFKKWRSLKVK